MHKPRILSRKRSFKTISGDSESKKSEPPEKKACDEKDVKEITVYVCSICLATALSSKGVAAHMLYSHSDHKDIKNLMHRSSNFTADSSKPITKMGRQYNTQYNCPHCKYRTVYLTCYNRHVATHENTKYECPLCSQTCVQLNNLKRHIQSEHPDMLQNLVIAG